MSDEQNAAAADHKRLADWILANCPEEIGGGDPKHGESAAEIAIRIIQERNRIRTVISTVHESVDDAIYQLGHTLNSKEAVDRVADTLCTLRLEVGEMMSGQKEDPVIGELQKELNDQQRMSTILRECVRDLLGWEEYGDDPGVPPEMWDVYMAARMLVDRADGNWDADAAGRAHMKWLKDLCRRPLREEIEKFGAFQKWWEKFDEAAKQYRLDPCSSEDKPYKVTAICSCGKQKIIKPSWMAEEVGELKSVDIEGILDIELYTCVCGRKVLVRNVKDIESLQRWRKMFDEAVREYRLTRHPRAALDPDKEAS